MTFSEYLTKNRIKEDDFALGDPNRYAAWQQMYEQMHPNSFYIAVKMVLNDVRNAFHLKEVPKTEKPAAEAGAAKPVVRRAAAMGSQTQPPSEAAQHDQPPAAAPDLKANQPAMPSRRAVIRKPATPADDTAAVPNAGSAETPAPPAATETPAEQTTPAAVPPRARPVFKRPAAPAADAPANQDEAPASTGAAESSQSLNPENPDSDKPKPRPRPVFKRPAPAPEQAAEKPAEAPKPETDPISPENLPLAQPNEQPAPEPPKPPRPRPVFRRPPPPADAESEV